MTKPMPPPTKLGTARLLLRPPSLSDVDDYFALSQSPEFALFALREPLNRDAILQRLRRAIELPWHERPELVVVLDDQLIGWVQLKVDQGDSSASLGYGIAPASWGRGFATEAARAMVDYGFETFGLAKIWARVDPRNLASVRVLEKLGMRLEGVLRSHVVRRGERADRAYYGILRHEWEATLTSQVIGE
jgi:[ribosomal protein S5]-alanine N-acetyltransferase